MKKATKPAAKKKRAAGKRAPKWQADYRQAIRWAINFLAVMEKCDEQRSCTYCENNGHAAIEMITAAMKARFRSTPNK